MQLQLYGKKIWLYNKPIDFRRSIDGLSSLIANDMRHTPQYGFVLIYKRLEKGRFYFELNREKGISEMNAEEGVCPTKCVNSRS